MVNDFHSMIIELDVCLAIIFGPRAHSLVIN